MTRASRRDLLLLLALSLAVRLLTAWLLRQPGYADAYYYAVGARQLSAGQGFDEPFIWNYLDPPPGVSHPGYLYWMPLTAVLGWLGMAVFGDSFRAIQAPFVLLSALLPLLAYGLAWDLTRKRQHAVLAGLLAVFPGFYTHFLVLPDNVAPFALAGGLCLWATGRGLRDRRPLWFGLAGLAAGLAHLSRADGLLLEIVTILTALSLFWPLGRAQPQSKIPVPHASGGQNPKSRIACVALALAGYLAVMVPWFIRNWQVIGAPLSGAGTATLFLTSYDDIFAYGWPLTPGSYLAWGWDAILRSKAEALLLNLQRLWVENLLIVLLPFTALGLWRLRRERLLWPFFLYAPLLFLAMTLAFTFPGVRGGLFHSGGALLPFIFAAAGPGLEAVLRWAARRRLVVPGGTNSPAWRVFSAGLVGLAVLISVWALWRAGALAGTNGNRWNEREAGYTEIGQWLADKAAAGQGVVVMAGDAPGLTWHTGHPAIAVPNEPLDTVLAVADRYGARYLVLDDFRPRTTDALYEGIASHPRLALRYVTPADRGAWQLYEIIPE